MRRQIDYDDKGATFSLSCADCPLKRHYAALGQTPKPCTSGIQTNMQGPVPLERCKYWGGDDQLGTVIDSKGKAILMGECQYQEEQSHE